MPLRHSEPMVGTEFELSTCGVVQTTHRLAALLPWTDHDIRELAAKVPVGWLDAYDAGPSSRVHGVTPLQAIERLQETAGVVRLLHLEHVPGLRSTVAAVVTEAQAFFTRTQPVVSSSSVLYVGSGRSSAPAHVDHHPNFFAQLRGTKRFFVARHASEDLQQEEIARHFASRVAGPRCIPDTDVTVHELGPGDALYVPPYTFHWVESDATTVSAAVSWSTASSLEQEAVYEFNAGLRRIGVRSAPPGIRPRLDHVKATVYRSPAAQRVMRLRRPT